ncbi:hypothetical protein ACOXH8_38990 [Nannocystis pusilla]
MTDEAARARDRAERSLRANVRERIDHGGYGDVAEYLYVASLAGLSGSPAELLARAPSYAGRESAGFVSMS